MFEVYYTYDDFGDHDMHWCTVATEEEAQRICDYANLHNYRCAENWWYTEATVSTADEILAPMIKECRKANSIKKEIDHMLCNIETAKEFNDQEEVELFSKILAKLQAELAEIKEG